MRHDSAGVTLVTDAVPAGLPDAAPGAPMAPAWGVQPRPELLVGEAEGGNADVFGEVADAVRLDDGTLVVADGQAQELRAFDASGRSLWTRGGEGGGPREFRRLRRIVHLPGDTLAAWDAVAPRLVLMTAGGDLVREVRLHSPGPTMGFYPLFGILADHSPVTGARLSAASLLGAHDGVRRDTAPILRLPGNSPVDTVAMAAGVESVVRHSEKTVMSSAVLFGRKTFVTAAGDRIYIGDDDRWEIDERDLDGRLLARFRMPREPRPLSGGQITAERQRRIDAAREGLSGLPSELRARFLAGLSTRISAIPARETLPAFADLRLDAAGRLWVEEPRVDPAGASRWIVLAPDGAVRAVAELPPGLDVLQIGRDFIVGRLKDALGVQRVAVYSLVREAASGGP
jgi:hypothetical protein